MGSMAAPEPISLVVTSVGTEQQAVEISEELVARCLAGAALADAARRLTASADPPRLTRARHRAAVSAAKAALEAALAADMPELRGEELRVSVRELGRLTGAVGVEDVLDAVFRQFCIGK